MRKELYDTENKTPLMLFCMKLYFVTSLIDKSFFFYFY